MKDLAGKAKEINEAAEYQPKSGYHKPAAGGRGSMVGNETKADMKGAMDGSPMDNFPLRRSRG